MLFTQMLFAQMLQHNVVKSQNVIISVRHIASITQAAAVMDIENVLCTRTCVETNSVNFVALHAIKCIE